MVVDKMPVLFVGHGSPMNMVADNSYTQSLTELAKKLPLPRAILVVSAHWQTRGTWLTTAEMPPMIYDFGGFPDELYQIRYPAPGGFGMLSGGGQWLDQAEIHAHPTRGIDHAAYAVLRHMYPAADVPLMELSLDLNLAAPAHFSFARRLAVLREQGVLIVGSGNIVHNLRLADFYNLDADPYPWALEFDSAVADALVNRRYRDLTEYEQRLPQARLAVPTDEHYLPLLYAAAVAEADETAVFFHSGYQNASMSMRCLRFG